MLVTLLVLPPLLLLPRTQHQVEVSPIGHYYKLSWGSTPSSQNGHKIRKWILDNSC